jgi:hypothetical protein
MRKTIWSVAAVAVVAVAGLMATSSTSEAGYRYYGRHYYSSWSYYPSYNYYYSNYYYYPTSYATSYDYHYVVYYPSQPRYYYYYNPYRRVYWGRYDVQTGGYSLLAEKDRKEHLSDIPESAFPKAGAMPTVPGTQDGLTLPVPPSAPTK